jgi:hypothetical protein
MGLATLRATFSQTHLVTLVLVLHEKSVIFSSLLHYLRQKRIIHPD